MDMAKQLHVSRQAYTNYENGTYEPSYETLIKISQILNVSIDNLLGNEGFGDGKEELIAEIEEAIKKHK